MQISSYIFSKPMIMLEQKLSESSIIINHISIFKTINFIPFRQYILLYKISYFSQIMCFVNIAKTVQFKYLQSTTKQMCDFPINMIVVQHALHSNNICLFSDKNLHIEKHTIESLLLLKFYIVLQTITINLFSE